MTTLRRIAPAACALLVWAAAGRAQDDAAAAEPAPPLRAAARIHAGNALIAVVEGALAAPGSVVIDYWPAAGGAALRSAPAASRGAAFRVELFRLRAATEYRYQARAAGADGRLSAPGPAAAGRFTTGELPPGLRDAVFDVWRGAPTLPVTYLEFRQSEFFGLAAFDGEGHVVWYFPAPDGEQPWVMARRPNGNVVYLAGFGGGTTSAGLVEIEPAGRELRRLTDVCAPFGPMHHEVRALADGRVLYLSRDVAWDGYGDSTAPQEGDTIGVWDAETGAAAIVWNIFDHLSPADRVAPASNRTLPGHPMWGGCDRDPRVQDWSHGNSAAVAADGSVLISLGHMNQVISVAPDFRSVRWRLGGPGGDFAFADPRDRFYAQHTAVPLANGNVLLFDNGTGRPYAEGGQFSRAVEIELDLQRMTARRVWEFWRRPPLYAACCSSVQRLPGGNTLILYGSSRAERCCRIFIIVEAAPDGSTVWEVGHRSPGKPNQYRVYAAPSIAGESVIGASAAGEPPANEPAASGPS